MFAEVPFLLETLGKHSGNGNQIHEMGPVTISWGKTELCGQKLAAGENETEHPGYLIAQDTFYVSNMKELACIAGRP